MTFAELNKKSAADLQKLLAEKREELRELRFKVAANQLTNVRQIRKVRQLIARILTRLSQLAATQDNA